MMKVANPTLKLAFQIQTNLTFKRARWYHNLIFETFLVLAVNRKIFTGKIHTLHGVHKMIITTKVTSGLSILRRLRDIVH